MPELVIVGGIAMTLLVLWWTTARIARQERHRASHVSRHENDQLRHTVTEMAKERHHYIRLAPR